MNNSADNQRQNHRNQPALLPEAVRHWLRHRFPSATAYSVSAATGISPGTVENWLCAKSSPSGQHVSVLLCVFGPEFLKSCIANAPDWIAEAAERERLRKIDLKIARLKAERDGIETGEISHGE